MTKPCDIDPFVQDPYLTCPYCDALPCAPCRGDDLSQIAQHRLQLLINKKLQDQQERTAND